jgi:hypothetical protein
MTCQPLGASRHEVGVRHDVRQCQLRLIAQCGRWFTSMWPVLDVYWHFSEPRDHYPGQILARFDPKKSSCHHIGNWKLINPLANECVALAMDMLYGQITTQYKNIPKYPMALLHWCLACIVHHSKTILATGCQPWTQFLQDFNSS